MRYIIYISVILLLFNFPLDTFAQSDSSNYRGIGSRSDKDTSGKRLALIIGNGTYTVPELSLSNPVSDARDMSNKLRTLQFDVKSSYNLNKQDMERSFENLTGELADIKVFIFYYAGHGVQVDGENYLVPVDAVIRKTEDIKERAVNLRVLLSELQSRTGAQADRLNVIILDACRNNPFNIANPPSRDLSGRRTIQPQSQGLARIDISKLTNTLIAYSTQSDSLASDGSGNNGLYTASLLDVIDRRGIKLTEVFQRVRSEVERKSMKLQIPWELSSLKEEFYFNGTVSEMRQGYEPPSELTSEGRWTVTSMRSIDLRTSQPLYDTGLVILSGMSVTIKIGGSGKVNLGSSGYSGPSGTSAVDNMKPAKNCQTGAIIAKIGQQYYCVNGEFNRIISESGPLSLGINESNLMDNSGSYAVKIQLQQLQHR